MRVKKLLSFLLAALVLASVCVPTFAEAEIIEGPVRAFYDEPAAGGEAEAPDAGLVIVEEDGPVIEEPAGDGEDHEHQWVDYERKEPTCDELGWTKSRCSVCGAEKTFNLGWLGHYFPEGLKEPPNLFGDYWATCQRCGKRFKFNTGKEPDVPIAKPPCGPGTVDDLP